MLCLYLQVREVLWTQERVRRTQSLFKIVPKFMKDVQRAKKDKDEDNLWERGLVMKDWLMIFLIIYNKYLYISILL